MNCRECRSSIVPRMEGLLDTRTTDEVGRHVASCNSCRTEWVQLLQLRDRLVSDAAVLSTKSAIVNPVMSRVLGQHVGDHS
jgi:hypothetical protein